MNIMIVIALCALVSAMTSWILIATAPLHHKVTADGSLGPQKIHHGSVPRIGGIPFAVGIFTYIYFAPEATMQFYSTLLIACLPVFIAGLCEDFTKRVSPMVRLIASLITGFTFVMLTDISITKIDIAFVDIILSLSLVSMIVTTLAVATLANGFNMIDGLNGLSIGTAGLMAMTIAGLAYSVNDYELALYGAIVAASVIGVGAFNFPNGKIFLGDGGVYLVGALIAILAIMLPERNPALSPFTSLLIILYPLYELLRSVARRMITDGSTAMMPDSRHLNSVLYKHELSKGVLQDLHANARASLKTLILPLFCCLWSLTFYGNSAITLAGCAIFILIYEAFLMRKSRAL